MAAAECKICEQFGVTCKFISGGREINIENEPKIETVVPIEECDAVTGKMTGAVYVRDILSAEIARAEASAIDG
jgi:hypothetical protein